MDSSPVAWHPPLVSQGAARILIVEDDDRLVLALEDVLKAEGYDIRTARNGLGAISALSTFTPDLMLIDMEMPGMGGAELLAWLEERRNQTPVIVASCNDDVREGDPGITRKLAKPYDLDKLLNAISAVLAPGPVAR
jgi:two-component system response regulator MprA